MSILESARKAAGREKKNKGYESAKLPDTKNTSKDRKTTSTEKKSSILESARKAAGRERQSGANYSSAPNSSKPRKTLSGNTQTTATDRAGVYATTPVSNTEKEVEALKNELSEKKIKYTEEYWQAVHDEAVSRFRSEGRWDAVEIETDAWNVVFEQQRAWEKEKEEIEKQIRLLSGAREATWKDAFVNSFKRGYEQSRFGDETYNKMWGLENEADAVNALLQSEEYQFEPEGFLKEAVSGASELLGQMGYLYSKPETYAKVGTATVAGAGTAALAGQAGPQIALPEEVATVPAGALLGFKTGMGMVSAENALRVEAGHAYNEMLEAGISHETAKKIALAVGTVNASLEVAQVDELIDAFRVLNRSGATSTVAEKIFKELTDRGVDVAKETLQEVTQEGVTMGGAEIAHRMDKGEGLYTLDDVGERLGDTAKSSVLAFGMLNTPATVTNIATVNPKNNANQGKTAQRGQSTTQTDTLEQAAMDVVASRNAKNQPVSSTPVSDARKAAEQMLKNDFEDEALIGDGYTSVSTKMKAQLEDKAMVESTTQFGETYYIQRKPDGKFFAMVEGEGSGGFVANELNKECDSFEEAYISCWEYIFNRNPDLYGKTIEGYLEDSRATTEDSIPAQEGNELKTPKNAQRSTSKEMSLAERLETQSKNNEPLSVEDVKKATGFGNSGAELISDYSNAEGATFNQITAEVKPSYFSGFNNPDLDVEKMNGAFDSEVQKEAYKAGQIDRKRQDLAQEMDTNQNSVDRFYGGKESNVNSATAKIDGSTENPSVNEDATNMDADTDENNPVRMYEIMDELGLTYDEQNGIIEYKSGESYSVNSLLRGGEELSDKQQSIKNGLNSALKKFPVYKGRGYRNIGFMKKDAFNDFIVEHTDKTTITYPAFTSASKTIDGYVVEAPYLVHYEIESVDGRDVSQIGIKSEKEILFATDTTFEILSIDKNENSLTIKMKEVNQNGKVKFEGTLGERGEQQSSEGNASKTEHKGNSEEIYSEPDIVRGGSAAYDEIYRGTSNSDSRGTERRSGADNKSSIRKTGDAAIREGELLGIDDSDGLSRNTSTNAPLAERLEAQSRNNEPLSVEDVKKATGFGEEGAKLVTRLANREGITFSQAEKAVKIAYNAGFTDLKAAKVNFENNLQKAAFDAGKIDRGVQDRVAKANAKNATIYDGVFTENEYTKKFTKTERKMISIFAEGLAMDISTVDEIIASETMVDGKKIKHYANASHEDGKMQISSDVGRILYKMVMHEGGHRMKQLAPSEFGVLMNALYKRAVRRSAGSGVSQSLIFDNVKAEHDNAGITMDTMGYFEEFAVRELETIFSSAREFNKWYAEISGNRQLRNSFERFIDWVLEVIDDIKRAFKYSKMSTQEKAEARRVLAELEYIKDLYAKVWRVAENVVAERRSEAQSEQIQKNTNLEVGATFSLKKTDIDALQSIGRKSVNSFTPEDIKKTEKFANRMWKELGVKSPFFRAWFGDWRANDSKTKVSVVEVNEKIVPDDALPKNIGVLLRTKLKNNELFRGEVINSDTGYKIQIGAFGYNDTLTYAQRELRKKGVSAEEAFRRINALSKIDDLIQSAVLLDTEVIADKDNLNRSFMHSFYIVAEVDGIKELIKIKVDELESSTNPTKRFYNLNDFEIINKKPLAVNWDLNPSTAANGSEGIASTNISISDLFNLVKSMDANFQPKPASVVVNEDGTPKAVYHGTSEDFTIFDITKSRSWDGVPDYDLPGFYFAENVEDGQGYGKTKEFYINITNPYKGDLYALAKERGSFRKAYDYLVSAGYDGVVVDEFGEGYNEYIVLKPEHIKSATDNIGTFDNSNRDVNFSLKSGVSATELLDTIEDMRNGKQKAVSTLSGYVDRGAISTELYEELIEKYGSIPKGEKPHRDIQVPRKTAKDKKVSQTVRTILEAKATPDEAVPTIEKMVEEGTFSYDVYTDKQAINDADSYIKEYGWDESLKDWFDSVEKGEVSKQITAMGWALYNNAANTAATTTSETERTSAIKTSLNILDAMVKHQRSAAQALQATRILKKLSPETQLYGVQKSVQALQKELTDKYGDKAPNLKIDEDLAEQFLKAETQEERDAIAKELYKDIGRQMPSRFIDKWNAWRYLAMLGNLRTHIRNVVGNAGFAPVVLAKDLTATAIETVVNRVSGKKIVRGKALITGSKTDRALLKASWSDYGNVADMISNGGKYNDSAMANQHIEEGRQIFKLKPLEWARRKNSALLETEDMWFSKPHYAYALAQYCKANNITAEQISKGRAIEPARAYAIKEAQKATYRDTNAFSQMVSEWGRSNSDNKNVAKKAFNAAVEGTLPFRKTPANILVRGVEYSPAGLLKGLSYDLVQVSKGKMSATEAIDNISAGLTGTGLLALGVLLAAQGLIRGHGEDDEEEKKFKELMGHQNYALELPNGKSITLDWLAPEALPFFVGVNLWELTKGSDEEANLSTILKAVSNISEPMLEMSCLQSLNDLFESVGYATSNDTSGLVSILSSAATSYLTQGIPTILGQAERTGEENRMTTYTEKNGFLTGDMQYTLGKASAKIPFLDYHQIPYIDAWGRKEASGTALKRGFNNFLNPAYTSTIDTSDVENELLRLYEETGEDGVFPERADKYFTVDGVRKDLAAEEYVRYATLKGEKSYKAVSDLVKSKAYKKLTDQEKAKAVKEVYDYANQKAKQAISNYKPDTWVNKADKFGANVGNYILFKTDVNSTKEKNGGKISKTEVADIILDMAQNDSETWKMYLSMYDSDKDMYAYNKGIGGETYMYFLDSLNDVDRPTESGKYGTYTQEEAYRAIRQLDGLSQKEKAVLWQSVNTSWKASKNPFR